MANYLGVATDQVTGNIQNMQLFRPTLSPVAVAANTTAEQTFTVPGIIAGSFIEVTNPSAQAGLGLVGARASAANTLAITFSNNTGASITPTASSVYVVLQVR